MNIIDGVALPFSAYCLMVLYICTKFQENISKGFRVIKWTSTEMYKGHNSIKYLGGVMVLVLCTSSDNAL